jgi:RNA polymerase sigma-70 factor (ECF subfamily)
VEQKPTLGGLYARYGRGVFRRARNLLGDADAAKDAMQDVFLRVLGADAGPGFTENPMAWLYRTTTNLCLNRLRDTRRRNHLLSEWSPDAMAGVDPDARMVLQNILRQVPEDLQEVAIYYYVDELSHQEIAEIVGLSRRTIGNRLASFHQAVGALTTPEAAS